MCWAFLRFVEDMFEDIRHPAVPGGPVVLSVGVHLAEERSDVGARAVGESRRGFLTLGGIGPSVIAAHQFG